MTSAYGYTDFQSFKNTGLCFWLFFWINVFDFIIQIFTTSYIITDSREHSMLVSWNVCSGFAEHQAWSNSGADCLLRVQQLDMKEAGR